MHVFLFRAMKLHWILLRLLLQNMLTSGTSSPYQGWNSTCVIENQAGDIVSATSTTGPNIPWVPIKADLCKLALGAHADWGTPDTFMPRSQATEFSDTSTDPGCSNTIRQATLSLLKDGIYACPAYRDCSMICKCGHASDYYCASWGCETTGDIYWSPSSTWDYIIIKRKFPVKLFMV